MDKFIKIHLSQLIPEVVAPCTCYIFFKGKYIPLIKKGEAIVLSKLAQVQLKGNYSGYIFAQDKEVWESWYSSFHPMISFESSETFKLDPKVQRSILKYLRYLEKIVNLGSNASDEMKRSFKILSGTIKDPAISWYFEQEISENIFQHSARVSIMFVLFFKSIPALTDIISDDEFYLLVLACVIHELDDHKEQFLENTTSQFTLNYILSREIILSRKLRDFIKLQDELVSGSGLPNQLDGDDIPIGIKIFTIINHFDHYCLNYLDLQGPSRREKRELILKDMFARSEDYDKNFLKLFSNFINVVDIAI